MTDNATKPQKEATKLSKEQLKKIKDAQEKFQKTVADRLKECEYQELDGNRYAFLFNKKRFEFRSPTLLEKTKIKAMLTEVTSFPGAFRQGGASFTIESSGDMDLICSTKFLTHTAVLMNEPEEFNPDDYSDGEQTDIGYTIWASEYRFNEDKKKASTAGQ